MFTLGQMAAHFERAAARCEGELIAMVETVTVRAGFLARSYIGHDQADWAPISSATTEGFRHESGRWIPGTVERGYGGAESPLFRTGSLVNSIDVDVGTLVGVVGSDSKVALYQELGTPNARYPTPPRPVFAKAMTEACEGVPELAEAVAISLLVPK